MLMGCVKEHCRAHMMCATLFLVLEPAEIRCKNTIFQPTNQIFIFFCYLCHCLCDFCMGKEEKTLMVVADMYCARTNTNKKTAPLALKASGSGTVLDLEHAT